MGGSTRKRRATMLVVLLIATTLAGFAVRPAAADEEPAPHGPLFPPPGGVDWSSSGSYGRTGGVNWSYQNLDLDAFRELWWGPIPNGVALSMNGSAPAVMTYEPGLSDLGNGVARWSGTTTMTTTSGSQSLQTRMELRSYHADNSPMSLQPADDIGAISELGDVGAVTEQIAGDFRINFIFLVSPNGTTWTPALDYYDAARTTGSGQVRVSFGGGFYWSNRPPACDDANLNTDRDTALAVELTCVDPDGDEVASIDVVDGPSHGTLSGSGASLTYTPDPLYYGPDSFSVNSSDQWETGETATIAIDVNYVDYPPIANDTLVETDRDTAVPLVLDAYDVDDQELTYTITQIPAHGTLTGTAPDFVYTPDEHYYGADELKFTATDPANLVSQEATVSITVAYVDYAPVAVDDQTSTEQYEAVTIDVLVNDYEIDGQTFTTTAAGGASHGTAVVNGDGSITYTPDATFKTTDTFTYTITDANGQTGTATVTVHAIGCGENGPVSGPIDTIGEPAAGKADRSAAVTLNGVNCDVVVGAGL